MYVKFNRPPEFTGIISTPLCGSIETYNAIFTRDSFGRFVPIIKICPEIDDDELVPRFKKYHSTYKKYVDSIYIDELDIRDLLLGKLLLGEKNITSLKVNTRYATYPFLKTLTYITRKFELFKKSEITRAKIKVFKLLYQQDPSKNVDKLIQFNNGITMYMDTNIFVVSYEDKETVKQIVKYLKRGTEDISAYDVIKDSFISSYETLVIFDNKWIIFQKWSPTEVHYFVLKLIEEKNRFGFIEVTDSFRRTMIKQKVVLVPSITTKTELEMLSFQDIVLMGRDRSTNHIEIIIRTLNVSIIVKLEPKYLITKKEFMRFSRITKKNIQYFGFDISMDVTLPYHVERVIKVYTIPVKVI